MNLLIATAAALMVLLQLTGTNCVPCCSPYQWETSVALAGFSNYQLTKGRMRMSYDYMSQLESVNETYVGPDGQVITSRRTIIDGNAQKAYVVDLIARTCVIRPYGGIPRQCVPAPLVFTNTVVLGDPYQPLTGLVYEGSIGNLNYSMTVTQKCIPISTVAVDGSNIYTWSLFNLTLGIRDRSVFNVPPECKSMEEFPKLVRVARGVAQKKDVACLNKFLLRPCF